MEPLSQWLFRNQQQYKRLVRTLWCNWLISMQTCRFYTVSLVDFQGLLFLIWYDFIASENRCNTAMKRLHLILLHKYFITGTKNGKKNNEVYMDFQHGVIHGDTMRPPVASVKLITLSTLQKGCTIIVQMYTERLLIKGCLIRIMLLYWSVTMQIRASVINEYLQCNKRPLSHL